MRIDYTTYVSRSVSGRDVLLRGKTNTNIIFCLYNSLMPALHNSQNNRKGERSQIALEFMIVFSFILILFLVIFAIAATERAASLASEEYSSMQGVTLEVSSYINQAVAAGSGFNATFSLPASISTQPYSLYVTSTGIVIANTIAGGGTVRAVSYSDSRSVNAQTTVSGTTVTMYSIPAYSGTINIRNFNGQIYIDETPPQSSILPSEISLSIPSSTYVANFSGALTNNVIVIPNPKQSLANSISIAFWINPINVGSGRLNPIAKEYWGEFALTMETNGGLSYYQGPNTSSSSYCDISAFPANTISNDHWQFIVITRSGNGIATDSIDGYYNNTQLLTGSCPGIPSSVSNANITIGKQYTGYGYGGYMSDIQIYNATLTSTQVGQLYSEGINGTPLNTKNLVVWLPLDGNANDYSGNNNNGIPMNISYANAEKAVVHVRSDNGANTIDVDTGLISTGTELATYTNDTGNVSFFPITNNLGAVNTTAIAYNGNPALAGNLIGFWPLLLGYGSTAYDLSTNGHSGTISSGVKWGPMPINATELQMADFDGSQYVHIKNPGLSNPLSFTVTAWVNPSNVPNFFRNIIASNCFRFEISSANGLVLGSSANCGTAGNLAANTPKDMLGNLSFVAATYNGTYGKIYYNGKLIGNNTLVFNSNAITSMNIGEDNLSGIGGLDYMYGNVSNIQVYSSALSPQLIEHIYTEGINGTPINGENLADWWPLDGNTNDYSSHHGNGYPANIIYANKVYYSNNSGVLSANFKGENSNSYINLGAAETNLSGDITVAGWAYPLNYSDYNYIFSNSRDCCGSYNGFELSIYGNTGGIFKIWNTSLGAQEYEYTQGGTVPLYRWSFFTGTYNGTYIKLYINGQLVSQNSATTPPGTPSSFNSYIGALGAYPATNEFNGSIADVQVYDTALNSTEVKQLYYQGLPLISRASTSYG